MDDYISRQAAIDALHMHLMYRMGTDSNKKRLDDWINSLPSAQETHEERTETHACDCISRAEAIELKPEFLNPNVNRETKEQTAIDRAYARGWNSCNTHWIKEIIEDLPSAQPAQQWIPCSEQLPPEENKTYWVCTDNGHQHECRWTNSNPIWTHSTTDWHWNIFDIQQYTKVVAWMELPKPYDGGEHDG